MAWKENAMIETATDDGIKNEAATSEAGDMTGAESLSDHVPSPLIESTDATMEIARTDYDNSNRPRPEWVRGKCPTCGDDVVSNCYYVGGRGYLMTWECWSSLGQSPTCNYRKVL